MHTSLQCDLNYLYIPIISEECFSSHLLPLVNHMLSYPLAPDDCCSYHTHGSMYRRNKIWLKRLLLLLLMVYSCGVESQTHVHATISYNNQEKAFQDRRQHFSVLHFIPSLHTQSKYLLSAFHPSACWAQAHATSARTCLTQLVTQTK